MKGLEIMMWTLFVLDFDGTYNHEYKESYGVRPKVYQIPLDRQREIESLAREASKKFNSCTDACEPIGDIFKGLLEDNGIKFHYVGDLKIRFKERQEDYLADYIPREIV
jgi:hypothetical protein